MFVKVGIICAISLYLCVWLCLRECKRLPADLSAAAAFAVYVYIVLSITVFRASQGGAPVMIPFYSYYLILSKGWHYMSLYVVEEVLGNVVLFVPLGLVCSAIKNRKAAAAAAICAALASSLAIEFAQLFTARGTFEVDDIIHNCLGAAFGLLLGFAVISFNNNEKKQALRYLAPAFAFAVIIGGCSLFSIIFR